MKRLTTLFALLLAAAALAQEQQGVILEESWFTVRINGAKAGWSHEVRRSVRDGGKDIVRYESSSETRIKRADMEIKLADDTYYDESPEGVPLKFRSRSLHSAMETVQTGEVRGDKLVVTVKAGGVEETKEHEWNADYLFPPGTDRLVKEKGFVAGTAYDCKVFNPDFGRVVTMSIKVVGPEKIDVAGQARDLTKLTATFDALPGVVYSMWLDSDAREIRNSASLMGMTIVGERTDRATALLSEKGDVPEILLQTLLRPQRRLKDPRRVAKAVYRIAIKEGDVQAGKLAYAGQTVDKVEGRTITITVDPTKPDASTPKLPITETGMGVYLEETAILQCRDPKIAAAAKEAVGDETDSWKAARKIERWVYDKIEKKNFGVGFATAKEVVERLEGDCTEHSVLAAAMARAAGIPSRIAVGLVSVQDFFGGHMWTEVWVGRWVPIDATLNGDFFDATHIKMGESAGKGTDLQEDLLGVLLYVGNMDLEIVETEEK